MIDNTDTISLVLSYDYSVAVRMPIKLSREHIYKLIPETAGMSKEDVCAYLSQNRSDCAQRLTAAGLHMSDNIGQTGFIDRVQTIINDEYMENPQITSADHGENYKHVCDAMQDTYDSSWHDEAKVHEVMKSAGLCYYPEEDDD